MPTPIGTTIDEEQDHHVDGRADRDHAGGLVGVGGVRLVQERGVDELDALAEDIDEQRAEEHEADRHGHEQEDVEGRSADAVALRASSRALGETLIRRPPGTSAQAADRDHVHDERDHEEREADREDGLVLDRTVGTSPMPVAPTNAVIV